MNHHTVLISAYLTPLLTPNTIDSSISTLHVFTSLGMTIYRSEKVFVVVVIVVTSFFSIS